MLEIFIPTEIKGYGKINIISDNIFRNIKENFTDLEVNTFESNFFLGIYLKSDIFSEDLIILCNGEFGENYFVDFDYLENSFEFLGVKIVGENKIGEKTEEIMLNIAEVTGKLNSDKLFTNTAKNDIKNKIDNSFFALSGVVFLLYSLKRETEENLDELNQVKEKIEFEGQAMLLSETSITKKIELEAGIKKLEGKIELFIGAIKSLIK